MNCYDGSPHMYTKEWSLNVMAFSSAIVNDLLLSNSFNTSKSDNILNFKQVIAPEHECVVPSEIISRFKEWRALLNEEGVLILNRMQVDMIELHDYKILNGLKQFSTQYRKFHPYLFCHFQRGIILTKKIHTWKPATDEEDNFLSHKSERKYKQFKTQKNFLHHQRTSRLVLLCEWRNNTLWSRTIIIVLKCDAKRFFSIATWVKSICIYLI